ncbi:MAG: hypothetical protein H6835_14940 [Planctomycetes bacterium]|nr:hypothetical protein [Planctomycetota bacterium]
MMLKIRRVEVTTGTDGRFVAKGMTGERLVVQAQKPGYTTAMKFGVKLDDPEIVVEIQRGVTIMGRVMAGEDAVVRFRVDTQSREIPKDKDGNVIAIDAAGDRGDRRHRGPWSERQPQHASGTQQRGGERIGDAAWTATGARCRPSTGASSCAACLPVACRCGCAPTASSSRRTRPSTSRQLPCEELLFVLGEGGDRQAARRRQASVPIQRRAGEYLTSRAATTAAEPFN